MVSVKKIALWGLVLAIIFFLGGFLFKWVKTPVSVSEEAVKIEEGDHAKGSEEAVNTLVEYSDFQCPACRNYYPLVNRLASENRGLRVVYRHFPLTSIHPNAYPASLAAEAAGLQGKFWEMHDTLFERQAEWSGERDVEDHFVSFASELGLDEEKFRDDMKSGEVREKVEKDIASANSLLVNATPTFFLNGKKIKNPSSLEEFLLLVEKEGDK